tara:strand:- start:475 stop:828 length:354 start_codon:yes stop_codon:yes gene_type:complete
MEVISKGQNGEIMGVSSCIQNTLDGRILIDIEVQPASRRTEVSGFNDWRNRLSITVTEQARDGQANRAVVQVLSELFELDNYSIEIVQGHTSRMKRVKITGKSTEYITRLIEMELSK